MTHERQLTYEVLARALFENYESIYEIDMETNAYNVFHQSRSYQLLKLTSHGDDFFGTLPVEVGRVVHPQDQQHVIKRLSKEALREGTRKNRVYSFVYRIERDGKERYHQLRATLQPIDDKEFVLVGVRDVDTLIRQQLAYRDEIDARRQKESNYLKAILDTAAAYIDANLTTDQILEHSSNRAEDIVKAFRQSPAGDAHRSYSTFQEWLCTTSVREKLDEYRTASSREHLLQCFNSGERRTSVHFSVDVAGCNLPCREVFFLYREHASGDVHALCVIYDLTEHQQRENEIRELTSALQLSRIRNSTSQMKPHFLYNVLGSIQEIILEDPAYASDLLENFTFYLRGCIKAMDSDQPVAFSRELENIKAYVNIEKMRFGHKLTVNYDLEELDFPILPLCVQPLVENAIRHGIYQRKDAGGTVNVRTWAERDAWIVQVEDNGVGFDEGELEHRLRTSDSDSSGLKNIRFRLENVLGATLDMASAIGRGTTATIRVPRKGA